MFSSLYFYLMIVVVVFAIGDLTGVATKGKLSGMMVVMFVFLVAFLTGALPADIISQAGLTMIADAGVGMVLFNMGTTINIKQLIQEWRVVAMAALCMVVSCIFMLFVSPIIGMDTVLGGGSDAGHFAAMGSPTLCSCGVRGEWNHTEKEYAVVESMFQRSKLFAAAVIEMDEFEGTLSSTAENI